MENNPRTLDVVEKLFYLLRKSLLRAGESRYKLIKRRSSKCEVQHYKNANQLGKTYFKSEVSNRLSLKRRRIQYDS